MRFSFFHLIFRKFISVSIVYDFWCTFLKQPLKKHSSQEFHPMNSDLLGYKEPLTGKYIEYLIIAVLETGFTYRLLPGESIYYETPEVFDRNRSFIDFMHLRSLINLIRCYFVNKILIKKYVHLPFARIV